MDIFIALLIGFGLGWASAWVIQCIPMLKDTSEKGLDYNMIEKSLGEFVDSKFDPENYLGQGEGTK
jgi:hypothetical protein